MSATAVGVQGVHGLREEEGARLRVVGLGVTAAPIVQRNLSKPPMVVLLADTQPVRDGEGNDRLALIDGDVTSFVCALDWRPAQELATLLETVAVQIRKRDEYGTTVPSEPRVFECYLPDTMVTAYLVVDLTQVVQGERALNAAVITVDRRQVALLGENQCAHLSQQLAAKARKVRLAMGDARAAAGV